MNIRFNEKIGINVKLDKLDKIFRIFFRQIVKILDLDLISIY